MLRSFLDEAESVRHTRRCEISTLVQLMTDREIKALLVCGEAAEGVFLEFCDEDSGMANVAKPYAIHNDYFGGDVNVTGLIVACDLLDQLPQDLTNTMVVLPEVMFNFDHVTLDGVREQEILNAIESRGGKGIVSMPNPGDLVDALGVGVQDMLGKKA